MIVVVGSWNEARPPSGAEPGVRPQPTMEPRQGSTDSVSVPDRGEQEIDRADRPLRTRLIWWLTPPLIRGVSRILWRLRVRVEEPIPSPPFVVAANHHSFLDPFLLGAVLGHRVRFIALSDLAGHYLLVDFALDAYGVVPVTRGKVPLGTMRQALQHLEGGGVVGLFPEGTRHHTFEPANSLPGAAWLAIRAGVPLVPVAIHGTEVVLGVDNRLRRGRIRLVIGSALRHSGHDRAAVDELTRRWGSWVADSIDAETSME